MSEGKQFKRSVFLYLMVLQLPLKPLGTRYWRSFQMLNFDIHIIPYISSEEAATNVVAEINVRAQQDGAKAAGF